MILGFENWNEDELKELNILQNLFPDLHKYVESYYLLNNRDLEKAKIEMKKADLIYGHYIFKNCPKCIEGYLIQNKKGNIWCHKCDYKSEEKE